MAKSTWDANIAKTFLQMPLPSVPSKSELKVFEKFIRSLAGKPDAKVLILGSTPGLRDLCLKYKVAHLCVEYQPKNFYILKQAMKYRGKEEILAADWRRMKLKEKFDLIIGDVAFALVPFAELDQVLIRLKKALKDNGLIVHRMRLRKKMNLPAFVNCLKTDHRLRRQKMQPYTSLLLPFIDYFYDEKNERTYYSQNIPKLKKFVDQGLLPQKDYDYMELYLGNYKIPASYPAKEKLEKKLNQYFKIKEILQGKNWYNSWTPIYILTKP